MENKIDRATYDKMVRDLENSLTSHSDMVHTEHFAVNSVNNMLIDAGIEIPAPNPLPDITQGEWQWAWHGPENASDERVEVKVVGGGRVYTRYCGWAGERKTARANAKLIAAAPEMALLCKDIYDNAKRLDGKHVSRLVDLLRKVGVISKGGDGDG